MAVKIHHGPPGSYKTSGAVMDDLVAAVFAGRTVITNVRGLDDPERIVSTLRKAHPRKPIPPTFELVWVDTDTEEGIFAVQTFWWWADCGAFILIDEAQAFWPSEMRPADWKPFDLPGGVDASRIQGRPRDYADAWTRHRHFNWDIVLTTPDIKLFHSKIRAVSETAYLHKNQAVVGLRGRYLEGMHLASKNGNASDFFVVRGRKIPKWVFDLYQSTSTGVVSDTNAGTPLWKNPKIAGLLIFLAFLVAFLVSRGNPFKAFKGSPASSNKTVVENASPSASGPVVASSPSNGPAVSAVPVYASDDPFSRMTGKSIFYAGSKPGLYRPVHLFEVCSDDEAIGTVFTDKALIELGYSIKRVDRELFILSQDNRQYFVRTRGVKYEKNTPF